MKISKQKHVKQNKAMHKTRLTQNTKVKHTSNAIKKRERKKSDINTSSLFPSTLPLNRRLGGRIETIQVRKEHEGFEKISKRSERGWKLILISRRNHAVALLSG